jgi:predicted nucleic acid-binding protein
MALLVDAGVLYAQADRRDPHHSAVVDVLTEEREPLVTSEIACAEADYLILTRLGVDSELAFLRDLAESTFVVECLTRTDFGTALELAEKYRELQLGLADLSLIVLARRYKSRRIATFDERAFRTVRPLQGGAFTLLPADA